MDQKNPAPIALQLWTIRDAIASDPDGALRRVREAGFAAVELAPLPPGLPPGRLAGPLARQGLNVVSIHGDLPTAANIRRWAELTRECGCPKIIWHGWPRDSRFDSPTGVRDLIAACNAAGAITWDHGLRFGMHNHCWEFEPVEGLAADARSYVDQHPKNPVPLQASLYFHERDRIVIMPGRALVLLDAGGQGPIPYAIRIGRVFPRVRLEDLQILPLQVKRP